MTSGGRLGLATGRPSDRVSVLDCSCFFEGDTPPPQRRRKRRHEQQQEEEEEEDAEELGQDPGAAGGSGDDGDDSSSNLDGLEDTGEHAYCSRVKG